MGQQGAVGAGEEGGSGEEEVQALSSQQYTLVESKGQQKKRRKQRKQLSQALAARRVPVGRAARLGGVKEEEEQGPQEWEEGAGLERTGV